MEDDDKRNPETLEEAKAYIEELYVLNDELYKIKNELEEDIKEEYRRNYILFDVIEKILSKEKVNA